jgi:hypothetical protein
MPRAIKNVKDDPRYFRDAPTNQPQSALPDRMLLSAAVLGAAVTVVGFVFAVARFFH